jgi:hypothetical protein
MFYLWLLKITLGEKEEERKNMEKKNKTEKKR